MCPLKVILSHRYFFPTAASKRPADPKKSSDPKPPKYDPAAVYAPSSARRSRDASRWVTDGYSSFPELLVYLLWRCLLRGNVREAISPGVIRKIGGSFNHLDVSNRIKNRNDYPKGYNIIQVLFRNRAQFSSIQHRKLNVNINER